MRPSAILAALVLFTPFLAGSVAQGDDLPHVRADGRRLTFGWHGGAPHRVDVSNLIRASTLDTVQVLVAHRTGDIDYFVVTVRGPSWSGAPNGSNAAGTESNLLWLKLKSWKLLDAQSMPYQSFLNSLEPIGDYHIKGGILTIRYANKRESTDYVLRYDSARPESKIAIDRASDVE